MDKTNVTSYYDNDNCDIISHHNLNCDFKFTDHIMNRGLDVVINNDLKHMISSIEYALTHNRKIIVVGVLSEHWESYCSMNSLSYKNDVAHMRVEATTIKQKEQVELHSIGTMRQRFSNTVKPFSCWVKKDKEKVLYIVTPPGKDIIIHYSKCVLHKIKEIIKDLGFREGTFQFNLTSIIYNDARKKIMEMMQLKESIKDEVKGSVVVLGNVELICSYVQTRPSFAWDIEGKNDLHKPDHKRFFSCKTLVSNRCKSLRVTFLAMRYPFFGDIAYHLTKELSQLGIKGIIHAGNFYKVSHQDKRSLYRTIQYDLSQRDTGAVAQLNVKDIFEDYECQNAISQGRNITLPDVFIATTKCMSTYQQNHGTLDFVTGYIADALKDTEIKFGSISIPRYSVYPCDVNKYYMNDGTTIHNRLSSVEMNTLITQQQEFLCNFLNYYKNLCSTVSR